MNSYPIPPVRGVKIFKSDVVVVREAGAANESPGTRSSITEFSKRSRQRLAFVACNTSVKFRTMITLTYPKEFPTDGRRVKANLNAFLAALERHQGRRPSYLWFLEFQIRGAPHYHILLDVPMPTRPVDIKNFRNWVAETWYRVVDSGDHKHREAGTRTERIRKRDGAARYAVKYSMKMKQKACPPDYRDVGRFWGCSRDVVPTECREVRCTEDDIRAVLDEWPYLPDDDHPVYHVLYRCADKFREHLQETDAI
jgi:hypothetical protein